MWADVEGEEGLSCLPKYLIKALLWLWQVPEST